MIRILIFLGLLVLVIFSCSGLINKKKISAKKVKELIFYNTMSEDIRTDIKTLSAFKSKSFSDSATVALLGNTVIVSRRGRDSIGARSSYNIEFNGYK